MLATELLQFYSSNLTSAYFYQLLPGKGKRECVNKANVQDYRMDPRSLQLIS